MEDSRGLISNGGAFFFTEFGTVVITDYILSNF